MDTGVHEFDVMAWLMNQPVQSVFARGGIYVTEAYRDLGDVDQAHISCALEGQGIGVVELTRNAIYGYDIRAEILGTRGAIRIGSQGATSVTILSQAGVQGDCVQSYRDRFRDAYRAELQAFVSDLIAGRPMRVTSRDGIRAVAVAEAAKQSLALSQSVEVAYVV